ncbi:MAG: hypothetical protein BYD32DRAFT_414607 [Podila humilis]|nr:MAG: hypothetical protein BYD32DRAFT_414607 [Podila humilis]
MDTTRHSRDLSGPSRTATYENVEESRYFRAALYQSFLYMVTIDTNTRLRLQVYNWWRKEAVVAVAL